MTAKVPITEIGRARLAISVAARFRRNRKITMITRPAASIRVNCISSIEALID